MPSIFLRSPHNLLPSGFEDNGGCLRYGENARAALPQQCRISVMGPPPALLQLSICPVELGAKRRPNHLAPSPSVSLISGGAMPCSSYSRPSSSSSKPDGGGVLEQYPQGRFLLTCRNRSPPPSVPTPHMLLLLLLLLTSGDVHPHPGPFTPPEHPIIHQNVNGLKSGTVHLPPYPLC